MKKWISHIIPVVVVMTISFGVKAQTQKEDLPDSLRFTIRKDYRQWHVMQRRF